MAEGADVDANIMLTDSEMDVNRKFKKAFCEPTNANFCPPISWAAVLLSFQKQLLVARKPSNGGDKMYMEVNSLREDFISGALHPGDLKPAVSKSLNEFLRPARERLKSSEFKRARANLERGKP